MTQFKWVARIFLRINRVKFMNLNSTVMCKTLFYASWLLSFGVTAEETTPKALQSRISAPPVMEVMASLLLIIGIILLVAWLVRRFGYFAVAKKGRLSIEASLPLGTRERVVLVKAEGVYLLLGVTASRIERLHEFSKDQVEEMVSDSEKKTSFGELMAEKLSNRTEAQ